MILFFAVNQFQHALPHAFTNQVIRLCIAVPVVREENQRQVNHPVGTTAGYEDNHVTNLPGALIVATGEIAPQPCIHVWGANDATLWSTMKGQHVDGIVTMSFGSGRCPRTFYSF